MAVTGLAQQFCTRGMYRRTGGRCIANCQRNAVGNTRGQRAGRCHFYIGQAGYWRVPCSETQQASILCLSVVSHPTSLSILLTLYVYIQTLSLCIQTLLFAHPRMWPSCKGHLQRVIESAWPAGSPMLST